MKLHIGQKSIDILIYRYINQSTALLIYKTTIIPLIDYADFIYDQNIKYTSKVVQKLQNRALRIIFNQHIKKYDERMSTEEMHQKANVHRLLHTREQHFILYAFDLKKHDINLDKREIPTRANRTVRLCTPKVRNKQFFRSVPYRAIEKWNKLHHTLTEIGNKDSFKKSLRDTYRNPYLE